MTVSLCFIMSLMIMIMITNVTIVAYVVNIESTVDNTNNNNNTFSSVSNNTNNDVIILWIIFCIAFSIYIISLITVGKLSITHSWLFTNLTVLQPTCESIASIIQQQTLYNNDNRQQQQNETHHHQQRHRQQQRNRNRTINNIVQRIQRRSQNRLNHDTLSSTYTTCSTGFSPQYRLQEQLSILEFTKSKIQSGVIASIQYRQHRRCQQVSASATVPEANGQNNVHNNNNDNRNVDDNDINNINNHHDNNSTTGTTNINNNEDSESFILWKYLETTVISCISCFVILIIRWIVHLRYCRSFAATLLAALTIGNHHNSNNKNNNNNNNNHNLFAPYTTEQKQLLQNGWNDINSTIESNNARWYLMLFILATIVTWFHLAFMASKLDSSTSVSTSSNNNSNGIKRNIFSSTARSLLYYFYNYSYSPYSYLCSILLTYFVWRHVGTKDHHPIGDIILTNNSNFTEYNYSSSSTTGSTTSTTSTWYTIDDALDELASRTLLLVRIFGWKSIDGIILWNIYRRSLRIIVAIMCGCFAFVLSDPIYTYQYSMLYRIYVGSGNDIQYNLKGIRNSSSSRWYNSQSKRVFFMETIWKIIVLLTLLIPIGNFAYYHYCRTSSSSPSSSSNNENSIISTIPGNGFETNGSRLLWLHISYVIVLCILARRFQQDYLLSALPLAVSILQQHNKYTTINGNSNTSTTSNDVGQQELNDNDDDDNNDNDITDDLNQLLMYPFLIRIQTILRNGTKLVCVPLLLTILFSINHISDFQRGPTTYPSAFGGPWQSTVLINRWHKYRTLSQISKFLVLPKSTSTGTTNSSLSMKHDISSTSSNTTATLTSILSSSSSAYDTFYALLANEEDADVQDDMTCPSSTATATTVLPTSVYTNLFKQMFTSLGYFVDTKQSENKNKICIQNSSSLSYPPNYKTSIDLKTISIQRLNKTVPSVLRKLQKLAKESLTDNILRTCITMGCNDINNTTNTDARRKDRNNRKNNNDHNRRNNKNNNKRLSQEEKETLRLLLLARQKVNTIKEELYEILDALIHHPLITAETVFTLSRFLEMTLCFFWTILLIPVFIINHKSLQRQRIAILQLNTSAYNANPQDADD